MATPIYAKKMTEQEHMTQWRLMNKDKIREINRRYRESHKEQERLTKAKWRKKNREKSNAYNRKFYAKLKTNPEKYKHYRNLNVKATKRRVRTLKETLIVLFGGCCQKCGYRRNLAALDFHHKNPLAKNGRTRLHIVQQRPQDYKLLCKNCHFEEHFPERNISPHPLVISHVEPEKREVVS